MKPMAKTSTCVLLLDFASREFIPGLFKTSSQETFLMLINWPYEAHGQDQYLSVTFVVVNRTTLRGKHIDSLFLFTLLAVLPLVGRKGGL